MCARRPIPAEPEHRAGIYPIGCNVPSHAPMMSGQLVVLSPEAVTGR